MVMQAMPRFHREIEVCFQKPQLIQQLKGGSHVRLRHLQRKRKMVALVPVVVKIAKQSLRVKDDRICILIRICMIRLLPNSYKELSTSLQVRQA
jgi:hypothetical protein